MARDCLWEQKDWRAAVFFLLSLSAIFLFAPAAQAAGTTTIFVPADITVPTAWTKADSPYLIRGVGNVRVNSTLTIEPGVVVKFDPVNPSFGRVNGVSVSAGGKILANGAASDPIIFTSSRDDLAGGDTNGDGLATSPQPGDWGSLKFDSDQSVLANVIVRYGGNDSIALGAVEIVNGSVLRWSGGGVNRSAVSGIGITNSARPTLTDLTLDHNADFGVYSNTIGRGLLAESRVAENGRGAFHLDVDNGLDIQSTAAVNNHPNIIDLQGKEIAHDAIWPAVPGVAIMSRSNGAIRVHAGASLTVAPGAMIKMLNGSGLYVEGSLAANGTAAAPITFTSWTDDSVGGWGGIYFNQAINSSLQFVNLRYGGIFQDFPMGLNDRDFVRVANAAVTMNQVTLEKGTDTALSVWGASAFLLASSTIRDTPRGIYLSTALPQAFHDNSFINTPVFALQNNSLALVDATQNFWGDDSGPTVASNTGGKGGAIVGNILYDPWIGKPTRPDPVIIIPGILGSAEKNGEWVIDPIFHTYDDLIETLDVNGYTKEQGLFTFPYDWRNSNVETAKILELKIQKVKQICQCAKVDLVAHSMGGLVARQYIQSDRYQHDVDQLIFLGTPHLGAPDAYLTWEGGEMAPGIINGFIKFLFTREAHKAGFASLFDYVRNRPISSIQEILPIFDYLREKSSGEMRLFPNNYPTNSFLQSLYDTSSTLFASGVRLTNIVGDIGPASTIQAFRVVDSPSLPKWEHGYPEGYNLSIGDNGIEKGVGDGTVPDKSAKIITIGLDQIASGHRALPDNAKGRLYTLLTKKEPQTLVDNFDLPSGRLLVLKLLSPVDIQVIAPDGKRIGKDFTTNQEINEIDGAFYSGFRTDNEFITIPNPMDGEYRVITQGTDNGGEYTVATGYITDTTSAEKDFTAQTVPGLQTELKVVIDQNVPDVIGVKPTDITPPAITILSPTSTTFTRSVLIPVNISITDVESGVQSQEIRFDGTIVQSGDAIDLFYQSLGEHILSVSATDRVGNTANSEMSLQVIATPESTISDIERSFSLGWITNAKIKDQLVKQAQKIIKLERRVDWLEKKLPGKPKIIRRIERIEKRIDRVLCRIIGKFLEREHNRGTINDQAYELLQEDINWLLNKLLNI